MRKIFLVLTAVALSSPVLAAFDSRDTVSPFGVLEFLPWSHDWNSNHYDEDKIDRAISMMKEAGVAMVRMDFLWADIEPEKGKFDFSKYDSIVNKLRENNIQVLGLLEYNPLWSGGEWNAAPNPDAYVKYASAVVEHFQYRVKYWEIWNEPDTAIYWTPQDDLKAYSDLLKKSYAVIKQIDPTSKVVMGGLAKDYPFKLRRLYQRAGKDSFDIVNIHPFVDPLKPDAVTLLKGIHTSVMKVMTEFKDDQKPIWFTEIGCPGITAETKSKTWWNGKAPTEAQQAEWVRKLYKEPLDWPNVKKIFWAFFRDTPDHFHNATDNLGLIREDFLAKPAYEAYREMSQKPLPDKFIAVDEEASSSLSSEFSQ